MFTPRNLLIAAFVFLLASTGLGFMNKQKLAGKQAELAQVHSSAATAQAETTKAKSEQQKAQKAAADAVAKASDLQTQLTTASEQTRDLNKKVEDANGNLTAKNTEIENLNKQMAELRNAPKAVEPSADLTAQVAALTRERDELKVVKDGFDNQLKAAQSQTSALQRRIAQRESGESMNGLRGRVLAVDRNWNFVVLDLGGRNGVNSNATMVIQRGGSMVGRVKITSVEPSQSVADIIPNSVPAGVSVQPGDTVVYSGS